MSSANLDNLTIKSHRNSSINNFSPVKQQGITQISNNNVQTQKQIEHIQNLKVDILPFSNKKVQIKEEQAVFKDKNLYNMNYTLNSQSQKKLQQISNNYYNSNTNNSSKNNKKQQQQQQYHLSKSASNRKYNTHQKYFKTEGDLDKTQENKHQKNRYGFFSRFENQTTRNHPNYNNQNNSIASLGSTKSLLGQASKTSTSFRFDIQGSHNDQEKLVGLFRKDLSDQQKNSGILSDNFHQYDFNLQQNVQQRKDELYENIEFEQMPSDQRIKSELYVNHLFKEKSSNHQKHNQYKQYDNVASQYNENHKKEEKTHNLIKIKKYVPPQIGQTINDSMSKFSQNMTAHGSSKRDSRVNAFQMKKDGLVYSKSMAFDANAAASLNVHIRTYYQDQEWHPQGRVGATLTCINGYIFLIGGRANELISDVAMLKTQKHHLQENKWISLSLYHNFGHEGKQKILKQIERKINPNAERPVIVRKLSKMASFLQKSPEIQQYQKRNTIIPPDQFTGRYNHTACAWKNDIVVFGGEQEFDNRYKKRSVLNEVFFFNTVTLSWTKKLCRGDVIEARRNHTACVVGSDMVVLGGLNSFEKTPLELSYLDLAELKWKTYGEQGNYKNIFETSGSLSYHACCPVYEELGRQKLHSSKFVKHNIKIKEQGIYYYGGKFPNNKINEDVYVLNTFTFPVTWKKLNTIGEKPKKRYLHKMEYDQVQNVIIIYGGMTERKDVSYLDDIWILKLKNLEWMRIDLINSTIRKPIANFSSCMEDTQLFIFGGIHQTGFYGGSLDIHEYDQKRVQQLKEGKDFSKRDVSFQEVQQKHVSSRASVQRNSILRSYLPLPEGGIAQAKRDSKRLPQMEYINEEDNDSFKEESQVSNQ